MSHDHKHDHTHGPDLSERRFSCSLAFQVKEGSKEYFNSVFEWDGFDYANVLSLEQLLIEVQQRLMQIGLIRAESCKGLEASAAVLKAQVEGQLESKAKK